MVDEIKIRFTENTRTSVNRIGLRPKKQKFRMKRHWQQMSDAMKKVNKQCLLDTPRTVRVSEKT